MKYFQKVVQYTQNLKGEDLHYRVLGLNDSSTKDDMKKSSCKLALRYHSDKNKHPQAYAVIHMIKDAK